eukprot:COSAG03_NODE_4136_length_1670_cov_1.628899_1_plen_66_part_10
MSGALTGHTQMTGARRGATRGVAGRIVQVYVVYTYTQEPAEGVKQQLRRHRTRRKLAVWSRSHSPR